MGTRKGRNEKRKEIANFINSPEGKKLLWEAHERIAASCANFQKSGRKNRDTTMIPFGPVDGSRIWPHQKPT